MPGMDDAFNMPASKTELPQHYSASQLRAIGQQCSGQLPPASAVQAMFLYEMRRQTEAEALFHGGIFQLAKCEDAVTGQHARLLKLENRMEKLEKAFAAQEVDSRLATSKLRMQVQQDALKACADRVNGLEARTADIDSAIAGLNSMQVKTSRTTPDPAVAATTSTLSEDDARRIKDELDVLFDDRDGILHIIKEVKDRIRRLEDNTRALTLQNSSRTTVSPSTRSPQLIAIQTSNGEAVDLGVPKGKPLVGLKENRPGAIRTYSPGK